MAFLNRIHSRQIANPQEIRPAAEKFNEFLDDRAEQLVGIYLTGKLQAAQTVPVSSQLLTALFSKLDPGALDRARTQLKTNYAQEYANLSRVKGQEAADAWADAVLVLERASGLQEKDTMMIYDFVANPKMLASDALQAFGGFFDLRYRQHDYDYGRSVAQIRLKQYAAMAGSVFFGLHWTPTAINEIDHSLDGLTIDKADVSVRQKVYSQISAAAETLLQELDVNVFLRKPMMWWFVKPKIKGLLAL
jgi:hypothetical protein